MVKKKTYLLLFFVVVMVNHVVAMNHVTPFLIENPFEKKKNDNIQYTLHTPVAETDAFFQEKAKGDQDDVFVEKLQQKEPELQEQNDHPVVVAPLLPAVQLQDLWAQARREEKKRISRPKKKVIMPPPLVKPLTMQKKTKRRWRKKSVYEDVFEKNKAGRFECPYNCPDKHTNPRGDKLIQHIKLRHDPGFDIDTFDAEQANLDAYVPRKKRGGKMGRKGYANVFEKNENDEFECPYNCPENYAHKQGRCVYSHVRRRHDSEFQVQTFDPTKVDLNVYKSRKKESGGNIRFHDIFEKNRDNEFMCPYNCPEEYTHVKGNRVAIHIRKRHDKSFLVATFNRDLIDLDVYIPPEKSGLKRGYIDIFEKNEDGEFVCPYNCQDKCAKKHGDHIVTHIKRRHDPNFSLQTFDPTIANLNAWIPRKHEGIRGKKTYGNVFERNAYGQYECPFNCPDKYAHASGQAVGAHIQRRHDKDFNLETFDPAIVDLNAYIPRQKGARSVRLYREVFARNESGKFECPFNCPDKYTHASGQSVKTHIQARHDKTFKLDVFDPETADLDAWIPRKSKKRKRKASLARNYDRDESNRKKKKRKLTI